MLESILDSSESLSVGTALICIIASLVLGLVISVIHMKTSKYTKNFVITLAILPVLVQVVMMMVNGNLGTSVAVLGAFSLVRFRSIPGNSREITSIFFAMAIGLAVGMGHIFFAFITTLVVGVMLLIFYKTKFGEKKEISRKLSVVIPESLDYTHVFDKVFEKYLDNYYLERVKTTNMGSMYELNYDIIFKDNRKEKKFIDDIRILNGNLKVVIAHSAEDDVL